MRILSSVGPILLPLIVTAVANAQPASAPPPAASQAPAASSAPVEDLTQSIQTSPTVSEPAPVAAPAPAPGPAPAPAAQPMVTQSVQGSPEMAPAVVEPSPIETIHRGFYMRIGNGMSLLGLTGNGPRGSASIKALGGLNTISLGGSIARGVVLGGAIINSQATAKFNGGAYENRSIALDDRTVPASSKVDAAFTQLGVFVDWFPDPVGGWHVGAAAGFGVISILNRADDDTDNAMFGSSFSGSLFGGYDWSLGKAWSLGLSLSASGIGSTTLKYANDGSESGYRLHGGSIGIQGSLLYF